MIPKSDHRFADRIMRQKSWQKNWQKNSQES